jgi:DNA end-binding protein Ku
LAVECGIGHGHRFDVLIVTRFAAERSITCYEAYGQPEAATVNQMPSIVWKGYITFGLVSFPVRLYSAARSESVHFHMLHRKDLSRVKEVWYCAEENKPIERTDIVKGYEASKGEYIVVGDEELKKIAPPTATTMEVLQFAAEEDVDPIWFERSYYVAGDEKVSKPYTLFVHALKETGHYAVAKLSMHARENIVLLRVAEGGLILHTLFYPGELHKGNRQTGLAKTNSSRQELDLAKTLIQQLSGPFKPDEFHDTYRDNVEKLIEQKSKGKKVTVVQQPRHAPVVDLMEALKRSLKNNKSTHEKASKKKPARSKAA